MRKLILVVAFEQRAHCQEVLYRNGRLAPIWVLHRLLIGEKTHHLSIGPQHFAIDSNAYKHADDSFRCRSRVAQRLNPIGVEVVFIDEIAVSSHENAGDILEISVANGLLHLLEPRFAQVQVRRSGARKSEASVEDAGFPSAIAPRPMSPSTTAAR